MKRKILAVMGICLLCTACNKQDTKTVDVEAQSNIQKAIETTFNENCIAFKGDIVSTSSDEFASYSATIYKDNYTYSVKQNAEGFSVTDYSDGSSYYVYNSDGAYEMPIKCLDTNAKAFYLNTIKGLEWVATDLGYEATLTEPQVETIVNGYLVAQYNGIEKSSNDVVLQDYAKKATKYLSSDTYPSGTLTVLLDGGKLKAVILQYKSLFLLVLI